MLRTQGRPPAKKVGAVGSLLLGLGMALVCTGASPGLAPRPSSEAAPGGQTLQAALQLYRIMRPPLGASNGVFEIGVFRQGRWQVAATLPGDKFLRTREVPLALPPGKGAVRLRIAQKGGGRAYLDRVALEGRTPTGLSGPVLAKLRVADFDIAPLPQGGLHLAFPEGAPGGAAMLTLRGRIEAPVISKVPLHFPRANAGTLMSDQSAFYSYRLGSKPGRLTLDGELNGESLGKPFFHEFLPVGSGHPQAATRAWVRDDGRTLFVALDFLADNTMDGDLDFAKVYVNTAQGLRVFKSTAGEQRWGRPGFTYTPRVGYQHKVYEFAIPLRELGNPGAGGEIPFAVAAYGTATYRTSPSIAYNSIDNEFLVVFAYSNNGNIGAFRVDTAGNFIGSEIPVHSSSELFQPAVAHDPFNNRYLVTWYDFVPSSYEIEARVVNADGSLPFGAFSVLDEPSVNEVRKPDVAYDPANHQFLVVFERWVGSDDDIFGRRIDADGEPAIAGPEFPVSSKPASQDTPRVAFDPETERFLVVWGNKTDLTIDGQLVNADGTLFDQDGDSTPEADEDNISISTQGGDISPEPMVAYDSAVGRFLVVWTGEGGANNEIFGQLVNADGTLQGPDATTNIPISEIANGTDQEASAVAYNPATGQFQVVWEDDPSSDYDVMTRAVSADGTPLATAAHVFQTPSVDEFSLEIAANPPCQNFVLAHQVYDTGTNTMEATPIGSCSALPWLVWPGGAASPTTVTSGDTATFAVIYVHPAGTLPTQAQLWIDLDGDGVYAEPAGAGTVHGGSGGTGGGPGLPAALLGLLLLGGLGWARGKRRLRPVGALAAVGLALLLAGPACTSSSGGDSGGEAAAERYDLTAADSADDDVTDGKLYTLALTIEGEPRTVNYRFVFSDGTTEGDGSPSQVQALTVE